MNERRHGTRRFPRISSQHVVMFRRLDGSEREDLAKTREVGLGGCMFVTDEPLEPGTPLELMISVERRVVRCHARVVYAIEQDPETWQVGVEFLQVPEADRAALASLFDL